MHVDPATLGRMGFWEYVALVQGWNEIHGDGEVPIEPPSRSEFEDMVRRLG